MWSYEVATGRLLNAAGDHVATGYSGLGDGKNNPADETVSNVGPIPAGDYTIGRPRNVTTPGPHGPYVLPLTPDADNDMHGRAGFLIHGDSVHHPGAASHGCIILDHTTRLLISASGDTRLRVA